MVDQMVGADVEQLDALARDLRAAADQLESLTRSLGGRITAAPWSGRDATAFRHEWQGRHAAAVRSAQEALRAAAGVVTTNAAQQRQASQSAGGSGGGDPWTAGRVIHDVRSGAGKVGDVADTVQLMADSVAVGAGGVAAVGLFVPGIGWIDTAAAGTVAAGAAAVGEGAGWVSLAGHGIEDPTSPDFIEDAVVKSLTGGVVGKSGIDAVDGLVQGSGGVAEGLIDAFTD
jgi:uncharacterized protein YukE